MGCWNGTCALTNLPIYTGEEVVLFIVKETNLKACSGSGYCNTTDLFEPISLPIIGTYNDYGSIENIKNEELILPKIKKMFKENSLVLVPSYEDDLDIDNLSLEQILRQIERNNVTSPESPEIIKLYQLEGITKPNDLNVGFVMFHKKIYDILINEANDNFYRDKYLSIIKNIQEIEDVSDIYKYSSMFRTKLSITFDYILDMVSNYKEDVFNKIVELSVIDSILSSTRKSWIPQCGAGSQGTTDSFYALISNFILEKYEKDNEEY